ncbi:MAG: cyclic 2,3-diphosphoglycerate synthetase [Actinomycetota bacterium]
MRVVALVDGEHYPPVTRWGLDVARAAGLEPVAALFLGGTEKVASGEPPELGVRVVTASLDRAASLAALLDEVRPDGVLDLSDEPVLSTADRLLLVAVALARGVVYVGAGFRFDPPITEPPLDVATVAVIGTGKRTGKTAVSAEVVRHADRAGLRPVVVAMGRGGPAEPVEVPAGGIGLDRLRALVERGEHAASDYLEDAVTTAVPTFGARRVGGGLAGGAFASNVAEAAARAAGTGPGLVVLEGSGATVPPVPWDAGVLVATAATAEAQLGEALGPYRLLLSDLIVLTMSSSPSAGLENLPALRSLVQRIRGDARLIVTDFEPVPLGDVQGRDAFFATTAPPEVAARQAASLQTRSGCRVVGWSARLADRAGLGRDMDEAEGFDVLLTELKAAAIDVAARRAEALGAQVVFVDNRPVTVEGDGDLPGELDRVLALAAGRRATR